MHVSEAVARRHSVRRFLPDPVGDDVLRDLLRGASRSPSGGNVQPWRDLRRQRRVDGAIPRVHRRPTHRWRRVRHLPPDLWEPYRTNRFTIGEQMYASIGIARDDKMAG